MSPISYCQLNILYTLIKFIYVCINKIFFSNEKPFKEHTFNIHISNTSHRKRTRLPQIQFHVQQLTHADLMSQDAVAVS